MGIDIRIRAEKNENGKWRTVPLTFPQGRDYDTFDVLANVRNEGSIAPIAEIRGFPVDTSINKDDFQYFYCVSWLTLQEMKLYAETVPSIHRNKLVPIHMAERFRAEGVLPEQWCTNTNSPDWEPLEWDVPFSDACHLFWTIIKHLQDINGNDDPNKIRIVFGFF